MKNKFASVLSKVLIKVGQTFDRNASPHNFYKPKKFK